MKKHYVRTTAICALLILMSAGSVIASPLVKVESVQGNACEEVTVSVVLVNMEGVEVAAVGVDLGYDSAYLTPTGAAIGPAGIEGGKDIISNEISPGVYRLGVLSFTDLSPIPDGIIADLTFLIDCSAPAGNYDLNNDASGSSPQGYELTMLAVNGEIEVSSGGTGGGDTGGGDTGGGGGGGGGGAPSTTTTTVMDEITTTTTTILPSDDNSTTTTSIIDDNPPPEETTTTTTVMAQICTLESLLGKASPELQVFRKLRDGRMAKTGLGILLTSLYYTHAEEITDILASDTQRIELARDLARDIALNIESGLENQGSIKVTQKQIDGILQLMKTIKREASPALSTSIALGLKNIENGFVFKTMRMEIEP